VTNGRCQARHAAAKTAAARRVSLTCHRFQRGSAVIPSRRSAIAVSTTLRLCRDLQAGTIPPIFYVDKLQENVGTLSSQSHQK
jgi:hypothetical protein